MQVKVRFFAMLRERVGRTELLMDIPEGSTVAELWSRLQQDFAPLSGIDIRLLYAVNGAYVDTRHELHGGDEVVFVPPVSGGFDVPAQ